MEPVTVVRGGGGSGVGACVGRRQDRWWQWQWLGLQVAEVVVGAMVLDVTERQARPSLASGGGQVPRGPPTVQCRRSPSFPLLCGPQTAPTLGAADTDPHWALRTPAVLSA